MLNLVLIFFIYCLIYIIINQGPRSNSGVGFGLFLKISKIYYILNCEPKSNMIQEPVAPARSSQSQAPCLALAKLGNHNVPGNPSDTTRAMKPLDRFSQIGDCL